MESTDYLRHYQAACDCIDDIVQYLVDQPGHAIELALQAGGEEAVQAMFDAALDSGFRKDLVEVMHAPSLSDEVRLQMEKLLYGSFRPLAALLVKKLH